MSRNTKIAILGAGGCLLALCALAACVIVFGIARLGQSVTDPNQGKQVGQQIAGYELPSGYHEIGGMDLLGSKYVVIGPQTQNRPGLIIVLFQIPGGVDSQQVENQVRGIMAGQFSGAAGQTQKVGEENVTIKDQPVTLSIYEGTNTGGESVREVTGVFQGNSGPVMIMAVGPRDSFDQAALDAFLQSIR